jgi:hypothetical protein
MLISPFPCMVHIHYIILFLPWNIWWRVQIMKILVQVLQCSNTSSCSNILNTLSSNICSCLKVTGKARCPYGKFTLWDWIIKEERFNIINHRFIIQLFEHSYDLLSGYRRLRNRIQAFISSNTGHSHCILYITEVATHVNYHHLSSMSEWLSTGKIDKLVMPSVNACLAFSFTSLNVISFVNSYFSSSFWS